ncbi:MAG TPA: homoserine kinase [Acidobacteriaceae bacterium]
MSFRLRLPATSANLGPGFDAAGLAMSLYLTVEAEVADEFSIVATGRDAERIGRVERSLIMDTYFHLLRSALQEAPPLRLSLHNEIPLGMGFGSSAAAILAGVALADHFGDLRMGDGNIVGAATQIEGHPDNVAACWYGGFTVSALTEGGGKAATFAGNPEWRLLLAVQAASLATKKARALLPETYSKADAVFNVQRVALLTAAFAQGRLDLLATAMQDRLHQPYRLEACPLLKALLPLSGAEGIAGAALSGAGPSVLMVLADGANEDEVKARVRAAVEEDVELISLRIAGGARISVEV